MLPPNIIRCLDAIVALRRKGSVDGEWWVNLRHRQLGELLTAENRSEVLDYLAPHMTDSVLRALEIDHIVTADKECLWPESPPLASPTCLDMMRRNGLIHPPPDENDDRYRRYVKLLLDPPPDGPEYHLCVVCQPSFDCDWTIRLVQKTDSSHILLLRVWEPERFEGGSITTIGLTNNAADFPLDLSELVLAAWRKMTSRTRHPTLAGGAGFDGIAYQFACRSPDQQWMGGRTWSPDPETAVGKLVTLSHLLRDYVESSDAVRDEIANAIRSAGKWFSRWGDI